MLRYTCPKNAFINRLSSKLKERTTLEVSSKSIKSEPVNGANELTTQFGANLGANEHCILHIKNT